jgi:hypothetical protein
MVKRNHDMSERMFKDLSTEDRYRLADMLMHVKRNLVSIRGQSGVADPAGSEFQES